MTILITDVALLASCIVLSITNTIDSNKTQERWKIILGYVLPIISICLGLLQQLITLLLGVFIISLGDGNHLHNDTVILILILLVLPLAIIISAIICIVRTSKLAKYQKSQNLNKE